MSKRKTYIGKNRECEYCEQYVRYSLTPAVLGMHYDSMVTRHPVKIECRKARRYTIDGEEFYDRRREN